MFFATIDDFISSADKGTIRLFLVTLTHDSMNLIGKEMFGWTTEERRLKKDTLFIS